jgi:hypothetical protein
MHRHRYEPVARERGHQVPVPEREVAKDERRREARVIRGRRRDRLLRAREHGNECTGDGLCGAEHGRDAEVAGGVAAANDGRGGRQGVGERVAVHCGRVCEDRRSTPFLSVPSPFVLYPISNMAIRCFYCQKDIAKADAKRCAQCMYACLLCAHTCTSDARAPSGSSSIA